MQFRALLSAALVLLCLGSSPASYAGQDRMLFPPNGGPGHGGKINLLVVPAISTVFAAIEGGGIYKTTDNGANWVASHQGLGNMLVRGMALKTGSTSTIYAITNGGGGFYKSTDTGATWNVSNTGLVCTLVTNMIVINTGVNAGRIVVTTGCGGANAVFASSNEGASWTSLTAGQISTSAQFVTVSGNADGSVLRASTSIGVYFSFDSGVTWTQRNGTLPNVITGPNGPFVIATQAFGPNTLALVDGNGIFYSTDSGLNWSQANGLPPAADGIGGVSIIGSKLYYFVDGAGAYSSTDNGLNWAPDATLGGLPTRRVRNVLLQGAGPTGWSGTLSGVYKTVDGGATWTRSSNGLPGGFVVNMTGVTGSPQTLFAAADTIYKSTDGGATWAVSDTGLGGATFLSTLQGRGVGPVQSDPSNPLVLYAATVSRGMYKSVDGGSTWSPINNGLPANLTGKGGNFRLSPSDPNVLYVPIGGVLFKTIDGGANWTNVWTSPTVSGTQVRAPAIDPNDVNTVYAATSGGVFKSTDGGANWVAKHPGGFTLPFNTSRLQVMSGASQNLLLAAFTSDARDVATSTSGLYLSTNGGDTWRQLVSNEKITQAIFVNTPGSSKVTAYINSLGYFDQPSAGPNASGGVFKCVDILGDFEPSDNCTQVDLGPDPGQHRSFFARADRLLGVTTSKGAARHQFMFLGPDFNNDSRADIFWRKAITGGNIIWHMSGAQFYGRNPDGFDAVMPFRSVDSNWVVAGMGDFDGNGTTDILWRHQLTGENYIYFMDGATILPSEGFIRTIADPAWQVAGVGDFDRDGRSDILWRNAMTGENYVYFMNGRTIVNEGFTRTVADPAWSVAGVGDFDGDGRADIFWRNSLTGQNYFYLMDGRAIAGEGFIRSVPVAWQVKGLGDFNQDNRMDIVWRNPTTGENYVYPMNGLSILPTETYLPTVADMAWDIVSVGDFHGTDKVNESLIRGRGLSGMLWRHGLNGTTYLWKMFNPLKVDASPCPAMGCPQGAFLPQVSDVGWQVTRK